MIIEKDIQIYWQYQCENDDIDQEPILLLFASRWVKVKNLQEVERLNQNREQMTPLEAPQTNKRIE